MDTETIDSPEVLKAELLKVSQAANIAGLPIELLLAMSINVMRDALEALHAGNIELVNTLVGKSKDYNTMIEYLLLGITPDKIVNIVIEQTKDKHYSAYASNVEGVYGAGFTIEEVKTSVNNAILLIKMLYVPENLPEILKGDFVLSYQPIING